MKFSFSEDQRLFASSLRELLAKECPPTRVRQAWDDGTGHAADVWTRLGETGVLGMLLPESAGGMGGDEIDLVLLLMEMGRAGVPGPVLEHAAVAAPLLADTEWSAGVADGSTVATVALDGDVVPHARAADLVVGPAGVVRVAEATLVDVDGLDGGRRLCRIDPGPTTPVATFAADVAADRAALAASAVLIGTAERLLDLAANYGRERHQFGQPIGSFQAVKHLLADALLKVDFARPAVERAAWSVATGQPTRARDVSMAKAFASEAALKAARASIQVHGAIGYTWECDVQLFAKKAWALAGAYGDSRSHRRRVADAVLGARQGGTA
jgi:alkylation response protein AidB-like acyl-CoA dehydrogenase